MLVPLLFKVYINDQMNSTDLLKIFLFADNTSLVSSSSSATDLNNLISKSNSELIKINKWFYVSNLPLDVTKSKYIIFRCRKPLPATSFATAKWK